MATIPRSGLPEPPQSCGAMLQTHTLRSLPFTPSQKLLDTCRRAAGVEGSSGTCLLCLTGTGLTFPPELGVPGFRQLLPRPPHQEGQAPVPQGSTPHDGQREPQDVGTAGDHMPVLL